MDDKNALFLERLREIFRLEAAEHIEAMSAGLLAFEQAGDVQRAQIVEQVFREAHSLKGAARSVSLPLVESMCAELERLFAVMKGRTPELSPDAFDALHQVLGVLATSCAEPAASPDGLRELQALARLRGLNRAEPSASSAEPASTAQGPETAPARPPLAPDTVRVQVQTLLALVEDAEAYAGVNITAELRASELQMLTQDLVKWNQRRRRQQVTLSRRTGDQGAQVSEFLESEMLYTRELEHALHKLADAASRDARALASTASKSLENTLHLLQCPVSHRFTALTGHLRDLARDLGKEADLVVHGSAVEIDRRLLDELWDPVLQLLRNSVDHGLEPPEIRRAMDKPVRGTVEITVRLLAGGRVEFIVADDGAGLDAVKVAHAAVHCGLVTAEAVAQLTVAEKLAFIFHPGLSTRPIVTDISGRGLGLAITREKVEKLGGTVSVTSTLGTGTRFRLLLPLRLATFRAVFVEVIGRRFGIPSHRVYRIVRFKPDEIQRVASRQAIAVEDRMVSLVCLRHVLRLTGPERTNEGLGLAVVVRVADQEVAFAVDAVHGESEVVFKSLGPQLPNVRNIDGACISANGAVVPILNAEQLVQSAATTVVAPPSAAPAAAAQRRFRLLVADDSITARTLVKEILEAAGYEVVVAVDGMDAFAQLKAASFDLAISDVEMPRLNGFELTAKMRADKELAELPVVLVTALRSQEDLEHGLNLGANAYIAKSDFKQSDLIAVIRRLLGSERVGVAHD